MTKRVHVVVSGRVQGVFFRAECADRARAEGVAGFVRNIAGGPVEAAFKGEDAAVDTMVAWCHRGPSWARVQGVEATEETPTGQRDFRIG
jgi:acylphosphatase